MKKFVITAALAFTLLGVSAVQAAFSPFIIRNGSTTSTPPLILPNIAYVPGATEFVINEGGQKAGYGTSQIDGQQIGDIQRWAITRHDDESRFAAGSGPAVAPYINLWVTDGAGKFAVIANEPSDPAFQALYNNGWDLDWNDIKDKPAKVFENADKTWLPNNGVGLTFQDVASYTIQAPSVAELTTGWAGLGGGAPRTLGTNVAYGFNWIFGDSLANYVSGMEGYVVSGASVPEPATLALAGAALVGLFATARRRAARG